MSNQIRFAIVGAGGIAQTHAQAISEIDEAVLVGVMDISTEAAQSMAEAFNCIAVESSEALIRECSPEAALICTPPVTHADLCRTFLEHEIAVLCEKPLCLDSETAKMLNDLAAAKGVPFTMASKFRFCDDVVRAKSIIDSGLLGEILLLENAFTAHVNMAGRWYSDPKISGGGVLIDNGTHSVDIIRYLLGPISQVQVVEGKRVQHLDVEDTVQIFARTDSGALCTVDLSWTFNKELDTFIQIYGSQGTVRVGWQESKYRQPNSDWIGFGTGYNKMDCFKNMLINFCNSITGKELSRIGPADALASVQVIESAYKSLGSVNWIAIERD
ncbi:Gfo/Idh/MocA family protein [Thermodesulfobacteriota bacterium B35]